MNVFLSYILFLQQYSTDKVKIQYICMKLGIKKTTMQAKFTAEPDCMPARLEPRHI